MTDVWHFVRALGGPKAVARACNITIAAVGSWQTADRIPPRHWLRLWRMAQARGLDWRPPGTEGFDLVERPMTRQRQRRR